MTVVFASVERKRSGRLSVNQNSPKSRDRPAIILVFHPDFRIICMRGGGRDENKRCFFSGVLPCFIDQAPTDAATLVRAVNGKIRQVTAIAKVGYRTGNPN